jgi:hypothetical protein
MKSAVLCMMLAGAALAGDAPPDVVGTWGTGQVSSIMFRDRVTGSYSDPSGTQVQYKFLPDGRYEYAALTTQSMYSCTTRLLTFKTGVVIYRAGELTFVPEKSTFTSRDSCNARYNYEKPAGMERDTYHWRVLDDQYGRKICLQNDKINGCAYRR